MPMFDYRCRNCGHEFEELVISWTVPDADITCPDCKQNDSEKQISAPMVSTGGSTSSLSSSSCSPSSGFS